MYENFELKKELVFDIIFSKKLRTLKKIYEQLNTRILKLGAPSETGNIVHSVKINVWKELLLIK